MIIINFKNGSRAEYPPETLQYIPGDKTVINVIDAETGVIIYDEAAEIIDTDYMKYFNLHTNPAQLFKAAARV